MPEIAGSVDSTVGAGSVGRLKDGNSLAGFLRTGGTRLPGATG